jgi:ORF6N domain
LRSQTPCDPPALAVSAGVDGLSERDVALELIPVPAIQARILVVRERQVMLDEDLAELYGVETGALTRER